MINNSFTDFVWAACNEHNFNTFYTDLPGYWKKGIFANPSTEPLVKDYCKS